LLFGAEELGVSGLEQFVEQSALTQARAAALLGLTQPRLNALLKGKIEQFGLDALVITARAPDCM
jgi:predicted XRE-type DNA-binding protein